MLLDPREMRLSQRGDEVLRRLPAALRARIGPETHACVLELRSEVHAGVAGVVGELAVLRAGLERALTVMGMRAACAGTCPSPVSPVLLSQAPRYRALGQAMRALALRPPTMALHVHLGVRHAEEAVRLLNGLRRHLPLLLALSANSPFCDGRDGGFASERSAIFQAFPRTGIPREFGDYGEYVRSIDGLLSSGALPDPTYLWWDARLQPALGTVEVRVMDSQTKLADTAGLVALIQCIARLELEERADANSCAPEVLAENHFLAARDGIDAMQIDPTSGRMEPIRHLIGPLLTRCRDHAEDLGCASELLSVERLAWLGGAGRQRRWLRSGAGIHGVVRMLVGSFSSGSARLAQPLVRI